MMIVVFKNSISISASTFYESKQCDSKYFIGFSKKCQIFSQSSRSNNLGMRKERHTDVAKLSMLNLIGYMLSMIISIYVTSPWSKSDN
jgi:hypothetical protein